MSEQALNLSMCEQALILEPGRATGDNNFNAKAQRRRDAKLSTFAICHLPPEEIWALKDVRLEIRRGAFEPNYGIIGMMTRMRICECVGLKSPKFAKGKMDNV